MGLFDFIFGSSGKEWEKKTTTIEIPVDEIPEWARKGIVTKESEEINLTELFEKESEKKEPKD